MSILFTCQILTSIACAVAACLNLAQTFRWRRLRRQMTPVCKVVMHGSERQLGIVGDLPEVGTVLYRLDPPAASKPTTQTVHV